MLNSAKRASCVAFIACLSSACATTVECHGVDWYQQGTRDARQGFDDGMAHRKGR